MPIKNLNSITVGESNAIDVKEIAWNPNDGTFDMGLLNDVVLQAGQEIHFYGKAQGVISNGDAVMFAGAQGDHLLMTVATQAVINANPEYFIGIATQDFVNNQFGYVTVFGKVRELDTTIYRDGDPSAEGKILWFDSEGTVAGALTTVIPEAPNAKIRIAAVTRDHQNEGSILVRPMTEPKLTQLQDVETSSVTRDDILTWNDVSERWENGANIDDFATAAQGSLADSAVQPSDLGTMAYEDADDYVDLTSNQTIRGDKIFSKSNAFPLIVHVESSADNFTTGLKVTNPSGDTGRIAWYNRPTNSSDMRFYNRINGTLVETMRMSAVGNLGIGTTSPTDTLDLFGGLRFTRNMNFNSSLSGRIYKASNHGLAIHAVEGTENDFALFTPIGRLKIIIPTGTDNVVINPTHGNVGIGTTSPVGKLSVRESGNGVYFTRHAGDDGTTGPVIAFANDSSKSIIASAGDGLTFRTRATGGSAFAGSEKMRIDSSGNVGIGTTSPAAKLQVAGDFRLGNGAYTSIDFNANPSSHQGNGGLEIKPSTVPGSGTANWYTRFASNVSTGTTQHNVTIDGNVGIGTTSPGSLFEIHKNSTSGQIATYRNNTGFFLHRTYADYNNDGAIVEFQQRIGVDGNYSRIGNYSNHPLYLMTNNSTNMTLLTNGNVGIGTTSPTAKLDVNGNTKITGTLDLNDGSNRTIIGTQAGGSGSNQTLLGYQSGQVSSSNNIVALGVLAARFSSGNHKIAIGDSAGRSSTNSNTVMIGSSAGVNTSSANSVMVGYQSGENSTGSNQTSIGYQSGHSNTGANQSAFGLSAGNSNTGDNQTAAGFQAGLDNIAVNQVSVGAFSGTRNTGSSQTAIGYGAAQDNTGANQAALGSFAGRNNTGVNQSAFGYEAGRDNTGGNQSAFGYLAGRDNIGANQSAFGRDAGNLNTGANQSAFGYAAGYLNTGSRQSAFGYAAGYLNTGVNQSAFGILAGRNNTGANQTALGYEAGRGNTGNDLVAIGYQAGKDNALANQFIVKQANVNATPLIQGDFNSGNVGIGTTSPTRKLEVVGSAYIGETDCGIDVVRQNADQIRINALNQELTAWNSLHLRADGTTGLVVQKDTNNVGIGTTSPDVKLDVAGSLKLRIPGEENLTARGIHIDTDTWSADKFISSYGNSGGDFHIRTISTGDGSTKGEVQLISTGGVSLNTNGQRRMTVDGNGNVGIGTTTPIYKLDVSGGSSNGIINIKSPTTGRSSLFFSDNVNGVGRFEYDFDEDWFRWVRGNSENMRLTSTGLGIGTTSPTAKLDVNGDIKVHDSLFIANSANNDNFEISNSGPVLGSVLNLNSIVTIGDASGGSTALTAFGNVVLNGSGDQKIESNTGDFLMSFNSSSYDFRFANSAIVANPALGKIHFSPSGSIMTTFDGLNNRVGIGTTNPGHLLDVNGDINSRGASKIGFNVHDAYSSGNIARYGMSRVGNVITLSGWDGVDISTRDNIRIKVANNGNVGIGTTSPSTKLHVRESTSLATGMTVQVNPDLFAGAGLINFLDNGGSNIGSIFYNGFSTSYNTSSDYRLKENVVAINEASNKLKRLNPVSFNFINRPEIKVDGFIAHEVQDIIPEAVVGEKDEVDNNGNPKYQGIDQSKLVPLLTAALQEAIDRIELLEMSIKQLQK